MKSFSELTGKEKIIELLRWICVPAAAVLSVLVLYMIVRVLLPLSVAQPPGTPRTPVSDFHRFVIPRISNILMAATFVFAGAIMAPRCRRATANVLAVLWILYSLNFYVLVHLSRGSPHYTDFVVAALAATGAAAYIYYSVKSTRMLAAYVDDPACVGMLTRSGEHDTRRTLDGPTT